MQNNDPGGRARRFAAYLADLASVLGDPRRYVAMINYCTGLLLPCERKSVEPIAAVTAPTRTAAQHQSLLHFVGQGDWSDKAVLERIRAYTIPHIERHGAISAWIVDDTSFPKKGTHSVGVARQYCGQLGKQENCQVAVSLSIANGHASLPVAYQLYLPQSWASDYARRKKAGVPEDVEFKTKPQIALAQITWACEAGLPRGVVIIDAGYGVETNFRNELSALKLKYVAGVKTTTTVWAPDMLTSENSRRGRARTPDGTASTPISVEKLALALPKSDWKTIRWRQGTNEVLSSRFARARVRPAHHRHDAATPEEWLLIEWPPNEERPTKFWLSTLRASITFAHLVSTAKLRWRIERDYLELKQEIGLGHFEGRGWRGFHHHATLSIAAYAFLLAERAAFPPTETPSARIFEKPALPNDYRPRGAANPHATPRTRFDCDSAV